jgi:formamidopyrimidine-DNA glycosylase
MDQRLVVGVGNIYACESLWRARLSPRRVAGFLRPAQAARLAAAIRTVLGEAIAAGGSSLRDYVRADGALGFFQDRFAVYGRAGLPCTVCGRPIEKLVQANRATFWCRRCQR